MSKEVIDATSTDIFGIDRRVIALGFARMADAMGNSFLIVVLPLYIASGNVTGNFLGFSESLVTGIVLGLFGLVSSFCQPFTGRFSDRIGKRRSFVLFGLVAFMFTNLLYIVAHSYAALLAIRTLQGIAAALTITASVALVSEVSRRESRGSNMGVYNSFRLLGFGAGPLASGIILETGPYTLPFIGEISGFVATFMIAGFAALVSAILVAFLVEDPEETRPSSGGVEIRFTSDEPGKTLDPIFALGLATFIMSTGFALLAAIEPQVNQRLSQGAFMFSLEFSALIGMMAIVQPLVGKLSDVYGRKIFIVTGLIFLAPITLAEGFVTTPLQMIIARALQGICAASVFAPALALAGDLAKKGQVSTQLSILTVSFGIGVSSGAFLSGYSIRFGFLTPFAVGAILAVFGAILVYSQVPHAQTSQ
ncbi:MFS transporter [Rhodohalobacter sp. 614A]|uniref:MFS transporter n=1 Tax=Rhodohalobacter sp. 614A TaxID=2908649 RepID=UPI001F3FC5BA|nr:MFS transporter [Rhodohalobacter sp. 614A]